MGMGIGIKETDPWFCNEVNNSIRLNKVVNYVKQKGR